MYMSIYIYICICIHNIYGISCIYIYMEFPHTVPISCCDAVHLSTVDTHNNTHTSIQTVTMQSYTLCMCHSMSQYNMRKSRQQKSILCV